MCLPPCVVSNTSQRMPTSTTEQLIKGGHAGYFQNIQDFVFYLFYLYFKIFDAIFFLFQETLETNQNATRRCCEGLCLYFLLAGCGEQPKGSWSKYELEVQ